MNEELIKKLLKLSEINLDSLNRSELNMYSFEEENKTLTEVYQALIYIGEKISSGLTNGFIQENEISYLDNLATRAVSLADEIKDFDPTQDGINPNAVKKEIISKIQSLKNDFSGQLRGAYSLLKIQEMKPGEFEKINRDELTKLKEIIKDAEVMRENLRDVSTESGIIIQSQIFSNQASKNSKSSKIWLGVSSVFLLLILAFLFFVYFEAERIDFENSAMVFYYTAVRIMVISVLSVALFQSLKIYRANKHLESVNTHRQNSLETFSLFSNSVENDSETKSLIITQATNAIFEHGQTGYILNDNNSNSNISFNVTESLSNK